MIAAEEIERRIREEWPEADINVNDLTGGADHYQVDITTDAFEGKMSVARHRMVYALFNDVMGGALHALSLNTKTPAEAQG